VEGEEILAKRPSRASVETRVSHWLAWHVDVKRRERENITGQWTLIHYIIYYSVKTLYNILSDYVKFYVE